MQSIQLFYDTGNFYINHYRFRNARVTIKCKYLKGRWQTSKIFHSYDKNLFVKIALSYSCINVLKIHIILS
jgi:hypothetical protein